MIIFWGRPHQQPKEKGLLLRSDCYMGSLRSVFAAITIDRYAAKNRLRRHSTPSPKRHSNIPCLPPLPIIKNDTQGNG
ncbi:MAG: hypothetical protein WCL14_06710 [Bacteroidota bacterium]